MSGPCTSCGACCASLRVQFHADHVRPRGGVPRALTTPAPTPNHVRMCGSAEGRCIALAGQVGEVVSCTIYVDRPPPCRDFEASWERAVHQPACDEARAAHGLPPLTRPE